MINIQIINSMVCEFRSPKNLAFVKDVARPLGGKWQSRKGAWVFDAGIVDELIDGAREHFPDARITLSEIEKPVLDRQSETKRKIIAGAALLKRYEANEPGDAEFVAWFDEQIELMSPANRILFGHKAQTKRWRFASTQPTVTETEITE